MQDKTKAIGELIEKAQDGVKAFFESESFKNYLSAMSKFHNYSSRNVQLILMQKPEATYVAGYQKWKKELKRIVRKGERGIQIIAYTPETRYDEVQKKDATGRPMFDREGNAVYTLEKKIKPAFQIKYVFDISQTEGEPLPKLQSRMDGEVKNYAAVYESLKRVSDFSVTFGEIEGDTLGVCNKTKEQIMIQSGLSEIQNIGVLAHEIAHEKLHFDWEGRKIDHRTKEIEAEATAYVVSEFLGLDTSEVAFPYIASWSKDKDTNLLYQSLDRIQRGANLIINDYEENYKALELEKGAESEENTKEKAAQKKQRELER